MKRFKKNNKGFSLVELIVVIAIMAILGVAVALAVTKFIPQSNRSTDISNAAMLGEAIEVVATEIQTEGGSLTGVDWAAQVVARGAVKEVPAVKGDASAYGVTASSASFTLGYSETDGATVKIGTNVFFGKAGSGERQVNGALYKENKLS